MNIKVTLPENISDITLDQYQRFVELTNRNDLSEIEYNKRVIKIFTGLKYNQVDKISHKDYSDIINQITAALGNETKFKNRFNIGDVEFGFIPNLDDMTTKEFIDLGSYMVSPENYHKIMAILFRPVKRKDSFGNYTISSYNGTNEFADIMKRTPLNIVLGAMGFFYHLANELKTHIQKSTRVEQVRGKRQVTLKSGAGMLQSIN